MEEVEREVGLVGMEDGNMGMVVWMSYEVDGLHGLAEGEPWVSHGGHGLHR